MPHDLQDHDSAELRRKASNECASLHERIATAATSAAGDTIGPEEYAGLALAPPPIPRYAQPHPELVASEARIASIAPELAALYNRFTLAWLIVNADPDEAALRLPTSARLLIPLHHARVLRQITTLEDSHYSLESNEFLKDMALLSFRLIPMGECSVEVSEGPGLRKLFRCRPVSLMQALRVLRLAAGALTPVFQAHIHLLAAGQSRDRDFLDTHHRIADLIAANDEVKVFVGESWMDDPNLEFITPHHTLLWRMVTQGGGVLVRVSRDETTRDRALAASALRRELFEDGKYVPATYMRIWPRDAMVRWSERFRPASWGPVGMAGRVPPPDRMGRRLRG